VTLAVTGGGATVTCTTNPLPAVSGVASFAGCKVTKAGTYTLTATDGTLTSAVSNSFTITAAAATTIAVYSGSPQSATVATAFTNPLVALVTDTYGNPVSGVVVTFTPPGSGASGTFSGGNTATTDANGRATSNTFTANTVAGTYNISATASGTNTVNFSETNNPGAATTIAVYSGSPQSATVATAFTNPLVALVTDTYGNPVSGVVVTFTPPGSGASGTFSGGNTATTDANGRATSNTFTANTVAGTYTVGASAPGTGTASFSLTNNPGAAVKLVFTQQPSTPTVAGVAFTTQPKVAIQDTYGNTVTGNTSSVTLAVTGGGATVTCTTNPLPAVSGVASFAGCKMTAAGSYTLTATDGSLTSARSNSFTITAATNLSQGKPVTCSSVEQVAFACAYAVDGNAGTRWSSAFSDPQWIYVDLGQSYNITQVVLMWEAAYGKSFQIQTSNDLTNWTTIYSTTTGTGGTQTLNSSNGLSSGSGRYVRMYGTVRGTQYGYSLYEFQVFGG
jgi:Asp/Glu/hydantoin racemase